MSVMMMVVLMVVVMVAVVVSSLGFQNVKLIFVYNYELMSYSSPVSSSVRYYKISLINNLKSYVDGPKEGREVRKKV